MNVVVLPFGNPSRAASTVYRVTQYEPLLAAHDIHLKFVDRDSPLKLILEEVEKADLVLNQKCILRRRDGRQIRAKARKLIFDIDDAMWTRPGRDYSGLTKLKVVGRLNWWLRKSDLVITANEYLGTYARKHAARVEVLPMSLDLSVWRPGVRAPKDEVVVGWAGSPVLLGLVERLEPVLAECLRRVPNLRLAVYCGRKPELKIPHTHVTYVPGTEAAFVQSLDIGLLPLEDSEYARGKSPIKSLQYMACGVPVVGQMVGGSTELVDAQTGITVKNPEDWIEAIVALARDAPRRRALGDAGIQRVRARHGVETVAEGLRALMLGVMA